MTKGLNSEATPHPDAPDSLMLDSMGQHVCAKCGGREFEVDADFVHHCKSCGATFFLIDADQVEVGDPFPPEN